MMMTTVDKDYDGNNNDHNDDNDHNNNDTTSGAGVDDGKHQWHWWWWKETAVAAVDKGRWQRRGGRQMTNATNKSWKSNGPAQQH
jgi:hypothetical protein